jgi:hypothetical protein
MKREYPLWTKNELTLVLDLFIRLGKKRVKQSHPDVIELSRLLSRSRGVATVRRSPDSITRKLGDYVRIQRDCDRGEESFGWRSTLARAVWMEFACDQPRLREFTNAFAKREDPVSPKKVPLEEMDEKLKAERMDMDEKLKAERMNVASLLGVLCIFIGMVLDAQMDTSGLTFLGVIVGIVLAGVKWPSDSSSSRKGSE